jgi:hypothetical protein
VAGLFTKLDRMYKYEKEFRKENPQTIGETDKHFDLDNYKDWLEKKLEGTIETLFKIMTDISKNTELQQSCITDAMPRFFVDERNGCIAIRDRRHPDFDAEHQGLDADLPDVVAFKMGEQIKFSNL